MSLWVKICANTSLADARLAAEAGADAVGFVFAPSPRRVTAEQVAAIVPHLPASIEKIGVFVDADFESIAATVEQCGLTGVQLHCEALESIAGRLREQFGAGLRIVQVLHFSNDAARQLTAVAADPNIDVVLIDSRTATAVGGTGIAFDWQTARAEIFTGHAELRLIAAGGLSPENVAEAIATLEPWGVDVASGVEYSPGHKDPNKVCAFVSRARAAAIKVTMAKAVFPVH
jgi:phosphoribosylanthranilate isomerase